MEFKKIKSKQQQIKDKGIEIFLCDIYIESIKKESVKFAGRIIKQPLFKRKVELIYKQVKLDHNKDKYIIGKIKRELKLKDKEEFMITKVEKIKSLGYGKYED